MNLRISEGIQQSRPQVTQRLPGWSGLKWFACLICNTRGKGNGWYRCGATGEFATAGRLQLNDFWLCQFIHQTKPPHSKDISWTRMFWLIQAKLPAARKSDLREYAPRRLLHIGALYALRIQFSNRRFEIVAH